MSCKFVVELQADDGYRYWSASMPEDAVNAYIDASVDGLSDVDHAGDCEGTCSDPVAA